MERHSSSLSVSTTRGGQQAFDSEVFLLDHPAELRIGEAVFR
jgi:hypothetical protein